MLSLNVWGSISGHLTLMNPISCADVFVLDSWVRIVMKLLVRCELRRRCLDVTWVRSLVLQVERASSVVPALL